jgi:hypothetical protein
MALGSRRSFWNSKTRRLLGGGGTGVAFEPTDADAIALIAAMNVEPPDALKRAYETYILALKSADIWTGLDIDYLLPVHDEQASRLNIKSPAAFTLIAVNSPTFLAFGGWTGDGATSRLRTQFTPSVSGVNFTQNSASMWVWVGTDIAGAALDIGSAAGANRLRVNTRNALNQVVGAINDSTDSVQALTSNTSIGLTGVQRTAAAEKKHWKNGIQLGSTLAVASTARPEFEQWLCGANSTAFSPRQIRSGTWASSLAGKELAFYNAKLAFMQAVGAA